MMHLMLSDQDKDPEMSMEEILTSIRRYVNTDDLNKTQNDEKLYSLPNNEPELIEVKEISNDIPAATILGLEQESFTPEPQILDAFSPFDKLEEALLLDKGTDAKQTKSNSNHIDWEEFIANLIRPMAQKWLDEKMPRIVERMVGEEIAKIKRR